MREIIQRIPMRIAALPYRAIGALLHIVEPNSPTRSWSTKSERSEPWLEDDPLIYI